MFRTTPGGTLANTRGKRLRAEAAGLCYLGRGTRPPQTPVMRFRHIIGPISLTMLLCLTLYLLVARQLLQEPQPAVSDGPNRAASTAPTTSRGPDERPATTIIDEIVTVPRQSQPAGRKQLEIFGRVVDADGRPLESVLVAEERYRHRARSDADGRYRLPLELPRHRYPVLHFLRNGYDAVRIRLGKRELDASPEYRLDIRLDHALDSVGVEGWVGDENGVGVADARVELSASYSRNHESFYLTEFTDDRGNFGFEGVRAGQTYTLTVDRSPHYPRYQDSDFLVERNPAPVRIELPALRFIDIEGMILTRDAMPVANYELYVTNLTTGIHKSKIVSDSSGFFRLEQFPQGEIDLATRGPEFYRITGLRLDADSYENLVLTVDRGDFHLSGWVSDENGIALEKAMVTVDRKFVEGPLSYTSYRSVGTDANGGFVFRGLGGGEHRVTAYAWGYEKQETTLRFDRPAKALYFRLRPSP